MEFGRERGEKEERVIGEESNKGRSKASVTPKARTIMKATRKVTDVTVS